MRRLSVSLCILSVFCLSIYGLAAGQISDGSEKRSDIYEQMLNEGLRNLEPYSYVLVLRAKSDLAHAKDLLAEAERHSPDSPAFYFEQARHNFPDLFTSMGDFLEGLKAYGRNFFWAFSLSGLLFVSLVLSLAVALTVVALIRFLLSLSLLAHDMTERKKLFTLLIILVASSVFGIGPFLLALLLLASLYLRGFSKTPAFLGFLLLFSCPFIFKTANVFLTAPTDKLRAVVETNEARGNNLALQALRGEQDKASRFSYALALKRVGQFTDALEAYQSIPEEERDYKTYTNLGNIYLAMGAPQPAEEAYKKAESLGGSAILFYNMSQFYRDIFQYSKGDEYFRKATEINRDAVSRFAAHASRNPNRFVIDETLSFRQLWHEAIRNSGTAIVPAINPSVISAVSLVLFASFLFMAKGAGKLARRCSRCGKIFCEKCARGPHRQDICPACYGSIIKPVEESPKDRVATLLKLQERQKRFKTIVRLFSFMPPGIAQIYAGRVLDGFIYLWVFAFAVLVAALDPIISVGLGPYSHRWLSVPMAIFAIVLYLSSNLSVRRRLEKGWL